MYHTKFFYSRWWLFLRKHFGWNRVNLHPGVFACIIKETFNLLQLKADQGYGFEGGYGGGRSNSRGKGINQFWVTKLAVNIFFCVFEISILFPECLVNKGSCNPYLEYLSKHRV